MKSHSKAEIHKLKINVLDFENQFFFQINYSILYKSVLIELKKNNSAKYYINW